MRSFTHWIHTFEQSSGDTIGQVTTFLLVYQSVPTHQFRSSGSDVRAEI